MTDEKVGTVGSQWGANLEASRFREVRQRCNCYTIILCYIYLLLYYTTSIRKVAVEL